MGYARASEFVTAYVLEYASESIVSQHLPTVVDLFLVRIYRLLPALADATFYSRLVDDLLFHRLYIDRMFPRLLDVFLHLRVLRRVLFCQRCMVVKYLTCTCKSYIVTNTFLHYSSLCSCLCLCESVAVLSLASATTYDCLLLSFDCPLLSYVR